MAGSEDIGPVLHHGPLDAAAAALHVIAVNSRRDRGRVKSKSSPPSRRKSAATAACHRPRLAIDVIR